MQTVTESLDALFCLAKARAKPSERSLLSAVQHVLLLVAGDSHHALINHASTRTPPTPTDLRDSHPLNPIHLVL